MPDLSHERAIKEYWREVREKYPELEFKDFARVCRAPFNFIKQMIRSGHLPVILIPFLGKIRVYSGRIVKVLGWLEEKLQRGNIDEEKYERRKKWLQNYLDLIKRDDEFTKTRKRN